MPESAFLDLLAADMLAHPNSVRPLDEGRWREIAVLIQDVAVDQQGDLPESLLT